MTNITKVSLTMVPVADQDTAVAFYTEKLGFEKRVDIPYGEGERWIEVAPSGSEATVALSPMREGQSEWTLGRMTGIALHSSDIDADHAPFTGAGVDADEVNRYGDPV